MRTVTVTASVPAWILDTIRRAAGERLVAETLGFGLTVMFGIPPIQRRQLADALATSADEDREGVEVAFAGAEGWTDDDMPLDEIVATAAAIVATVAHDPAARADFLRILHGEEGLQ